MRKSFLLLALLLTLLPACAENSANTKGTTTQGENAMAETERTITVSDANGNRVTFALNATSPAASLCKMLPLSVEVENYSTNEKIFYPKDKIEFGSDTLEGDCPAGTLALFSPWGNMVMFYGKASRYPGLFILGRATSGAENIRALSGTITVTAE